MHSNKFDHLYTDEEKKQMHLIEQKQFRYSLAMKAASIFTLMHLRFFRRPAGRPWMFDFSLLYFGTYLFLGSSIPGVFATWPDYMYLVKRMLLSDTLRKKGGSK